MYKKKRKSTLIWQAGRLGMLTLLSLLFSCEKLEVYELDPTADPPASELIDSDLAMEIMEDIGQVLNSRELLGIQVCITDSLNRSWSVSMGFTELDQNTPLRDQHLLRIGSVSKIYTATLIMRMVEEGYFTLDQDIADYFPAFDHVEGVTIRNLLQHSSGITDIFAIPAILINASHFPDKQWDPDHLAEVCMKKPLNFEPGSDQSYSNTNYIILGLIAEQVTGKPLSELFTEYLLEPLDLENTFFVPYQKAPPGLISGYVHHYALSLKEWYPTDPENTSWSTLAFSAGAMVTNATELSYYVHGLFWGALVRQESLDQMTEFSGRRGLGLVRMNVNDRTYYGHEGEITGFESITGYNPENGWTISICCNTTPFRVKELLEMIDARL